MAGGQILGIRYRPTASSCTQCPNKERLLLVELFKARHHGTTTLATCILLITAEMYCTQDPGVCSMLFCKRKGCTSTG